MKNDFYFRISCECNSSDMEMVSHYLFEAAAMGTEEKSEHELYGYFHDINDNDMEIMFKNFEKTLSTSGLSHVKCTKQKLPWENWQEGWKENFKPLEVGDSLIVLPPWEKHESSRKAIIINPGMGFGTGYHESTRLALTSIEWIFQRKNIKDIIDVGIGSGILSIAALHFGAEKIIGIDPEAEAIAETPENIKLSGFSNITLELITGSAKGKSLSASCVVANIIAEVLIDLKDDLVGFTKPGGILLLSGIIDEKLEEVKSVFSAHLQLIKHRTDGEWNSLIFEREN